MKTLPRMIHAGAGLAAAAGLYLMSRYSFLLFHTMVEMFIIAVAWGIFIVAWNARHVMENRYFLFAGTGYLFMGITDLLHVMGYKGMNIFPGYDANLPTQLWIAWQYLFGISMLGGFVFIRRKYRAEMILACFAGGTAILILMIFFRIFPDCFVEGSGLTPFKKISEILTSLMLAACIPLFRKYRADFPEDVLQMMVLSVLSAVIAKTFFIFYVSVYGISNLLGHYLLVLSFFFIYRAIVETGISRPSAILFRELDRRKTELEKSRNALELLSADLEKQVAVRTKELEQINRQLTAEIRERSHAEKSLRISEERYRITFEQASVGIALVAPDGRWVRVNPQICDILGYSKEELLKKTFQDITFPDDLNPVLENAERAMAGEIEGYSMENRCLHKNGSLVWAYLTVSLVRDASGNPEHFISVVQDITARKHFESLLNRRNAELEQINRYLDDFAYIVSHDLREPLRGMFGYANILAEDYGERLDDKGKSMLEKISALALRQEEQISAILRYSRVGRKELCIVTADLDAVIREVITSLKFKINESRTQIRISAPMPSLSCDREMIAEVFLNLISNAIKYNDKNEKLVEIGCRKNENGIFVFHVRDNGIGIEKKHYENIFKIFRRLHKPEDFQGGTGAGLTIVQKIIEHHGGKIWLESAVGQGSTFYFTLNDYRNGTHHGQISATPQQS